MGDAGLPVSHPPAVEAKKIVDMILAGNTRGTLELVASHSPSAASYDSLIDLLASRPDVIDPAFGYAKDGSGRLKFYPASPENGEVHIAIVQGMANQSKRVFDCHVSLMNQSRRYIILSPNAEAKTVRQLVHEAQPGLARGLVFILVVWTDGLVGGCISPTSWAQHETAQTRMRMSDAQALLGLIDDVQRAYGDQLRVILARHDDSGTLHWKGGLAILADIASLVAIGGSANLNPCSQGLTAGNVSGEVFSAHVQPIIDGRVHERMREAWKLVSALKDLATSARLQELRKGQPIMLSKAFATVLAKETLAKGQETTSPAQKALNEAYRRLKEEASAQRAQAKDEPWAVLGPGYAVQDIAPARAMVQQKMDIAGRDAPKSFGNEPRGGSKRARVETEDLEEEWNEIEAGIFGTVSSEQAEEEAVKDLEALRTVLGQYFIERRSDSQKEGDHRVCSRMAVLRWAKDQNTQAGRRAAAMLRGTKAELEQISVQLGGQFTVLTKEILSNRAM